MELPKNIFICDQSRMISDFLLKKWQKISNDAIQRRGFFTVALSGGKSPLTFYQKLATSGESLPWHKTHIFLVDERFVPFCDKDSNYKLLQETLFNKISIPPENIHPIQTDKATPQLSSILYEEDIRRYFKLTYRELPEFDLILLGVGEDGHTASLFPCHPVLHDCRHLAVGVTLDEIRHHRITLTLPVINNALNVVCLALGKNKAAILKKIIEEKDSHLPISMVNPKSGNLIFLVDAEAASELSPER